MMYSDLPSIYLEILDYEPDYCAAWAKLSWMFMAIEVVA